VSEVVRFPAFFFVKFNIVVKLPAHENYAAQLFADVFFTFHLKADFHCVRATYVSCVRHTWHVRNVTWALALPEWFYDLLSFQKVVKPLERMS
jgi:hypothetical protein